MQTVFALNEIGYLWKRIINVPLSIVIGQHYDRRELKRNYMKFTKNYKDHMSKYEVYDSVKDIFLAGDH